MSKQSKSSMPGYYGHTRDASAYEIADAAMRAYGHPWHARTVLLAHREYLASVGVREPANTDAAIELLELRASGKQVVTENSVYSRKRTYTALYDVNAVLAAWDAPYAASGVRVLSPCEQAAYDAWVFGNTLATAMREIADALYTMQVVQVTTKSGATHYAYLGEAESAIRKRKGFYLTLRDERGNALESKQGKPKQLAGSNVQYIDRANTFARYPSEGDA